MTGKKTSFKFVICNLLFVFFLLAPLPSLAFSPNYIISDQELEDYNSMTADEIQQFFVDHGSFLAYYDAIWPGTGLATRANEIIWLAAQKFQINPKFLLVLLEKEQSLISIQKPPSQKRLTWALGYAVCDKCSLKHPMVAKYGGFGSQIYYAADKIRNSFLAALETSGIIKSGFGVGVARKVDRKYKVTPVNKATAILYTYTPHIAGNQSFYILWKNWFSELKYPDGSLLQDVKSGGIYLIENGKKRPFLTESAFTSRYNKKQLVEATPSFLSKYETGEPITDDPNFPTGDLVQLKSTGGVYWVSAGIKYPIPDKSILKTLFLKAKPKLVDESLLEKYPKGEPLKLKDGTLVRGKTNPGVYFISDGKLRPIPSEEIFLAYNWKWENVVNTTDKIINSYELGAPITLEGDTDAPSDETANESAELIPLNAQPVSPDSASTTPEQNIPNDLGPISF